MFFNSLELLIIVIYFFTRNRHVLGQNEDNVFSVGIGGILEGDKCICRLPLFFLFGTCAGTEELIKTISNSDIPSHVCKSLEYSNIRPSFVYQHAVACHTGLRLVLMMTVNQRWTSVFIMHENNTDYETRQLMDDLNAMNITVANVNKDLVAHGVPIQKLISDGYANMVETGANFIILCQRHCVEELLSEANKLAQSTRRRSEMWQFGQWLVILYDNTRTEIESVIPHTKEISNIALLVLPESSLYMNSGGHDAQWNETEMIQLPISSLIWTTGGRCWVNTGYVDRYEGLVLRGKLFPNTAFGFNMKELTVTTHLWRPFVMSEVVNGATVYYGLCIDLLNELAEHYNFTYNISEPEDGEWGRLVGDRWTGMVGQLVAHEVDLVMAPISMQSEREEVIDFVPVPFYHDYTTVLLKRPDPNTSKWRIVLEPFKTEVMICIAAVLIAATIILYLMERYSVLYKSDQRTIAIDEVFLYLLGALLVEGCSQLPRSLAGRTVMSCWWLFCIVIVASYGGKLFAFLAIPKYKLPFTNLDEMVGQSEYKWGMLGGTFRITIFETSSQPTFKHVWEGIQQFNASDPTTLGLTSEGHMDKVRKGGYAFIGDYTGMQIRMATECDLITTTDKFFPMLYGVGLPNESPYANIFAKQMLAIIEGGLIDIWKSKWWPKDYRCLDTSQRGAKPIRLVDIQSVFFAIAAMFLLALIALFVELWVVHFQRRRQTNVDLSCSNKPCSQIYDGK